MSFITQLKGNYFCQLYNRILSSDYSKQINFLSFFCPAGSGGLLVSEEEGAADLAADQAQEQDWCGPAPGNTGR